jgi:cytochrome P450
MSRSGSAVLNQSSSALLVQAMFGSALGAGEAERVGQALAYLLDDMMQGMVTRQLPHTRKVLQESLRLYSPSYWIPAPARVRRMAYGCT